MIKRLWIFMALALCSAAAAFADVQVKSIDATTVEITFTYKDDAATEMNVIGSFDGWTVPGEAMTKNAAGLWEYKLKAAVTDEIQYKFYNKGTWIFDFKAPDKKDDGFGGNNGLIVVADLLAGGGSKAGAAGPGAAADRFAPKLNFGMYTIVGGLANFTTQGLVDKRVKGLESDNTLAKGKAYWKMGGTLMPSVTAWFEMKAFDGTIPVWAQDATGKVSPDFTTGLANLGAGLLAGPVYWLGGGTPYLNSVKAGLETPEIVWETGYGYAKPQKRTAILWETLEDRDANDGFMRFDLGPALQKVGPLKIEAALGPNKMAGTYGLFGWFDTAFVQDGLDMKIDFQYDVKSAASSDLARIFDKLYHQDLILGARAKLGDLTLSGQGLVNLFSESPFAVDKNLAGDLKAVWNLPGDLAGLTAGYRYTGLLSETLYGDNDSSESDTLGTKGTQRLLLNAYGKALPFLKLGADTKATLTTADFADLAIEFYAKPWLEADLASFLGRKSSLGAYGKLEYNLAPGAAYDGSGGPFVFGETGAKFYLSDPLPGAIASADVYLGLNNWEKSKTLTTLVTSLRMSKDLGAELGLGLRLPRADASAAIKAQNNLFACSLGGSWKLPLPGIKSPIVYGAFVYNMDPYDISGGGNDPTSGLDLSDYIVDGGVGKRDGQAQFRLLVKWDF